MSQLTCYLPPCTRAQQPPEPVDITAKLKSNRQKYFPKPKDCLSDGAFHDPHHLNCCFIFLFPMNISYLFYLESFETI